jgi:two-component system nitrate/nitrite response regulator NarL
MNASATNPKIAIIDTDLLLSNCLEILLGDTYEVLCAGDAQALLDYGAELVIVDGKGDAQGAVENIRAAAPDARILVLAGRFSQAEFVAAFQAGAQGYALKDISLPRFRRSIDLAMSGERVYPDQMIGVLTGEQPVHRDMNVVDAGLSAREKDVLGCLVNGMSNKVIAIKLNIMEATVKVHLKNLLRKTGMHNRTQVALWARDNGVSRRAA